jgi:hypothetical protein
VFVGAVLAFCAGDAKTGAMPSNSVKISAIASFFIGLVSPLAGLSVSLTSISRQARRRISPGSASSHFSHGDGRNARAIRARRQLPVFRLFSRTCAPRRARFTVAFVLAASKPPQGEVKSKKAKVRAGGA